MKIGKLKITASKWPWMPCKEHWSHMGETPQVYGWKSVPGMGRFGGGWRWKLGILVGKKQIALDLIVGSINFNWYGRNNDK